jgi:hypothetical protein
MSRPTACALITLFSAALLCGCGTSTLPTAESLSANAQVLREQARPEFDELDRRRALSGLTEADYQAEKAALEKRISNQARDAAWSRHSLAQSERKALGLPTPDAPQTIIAPNALVGGAGGGGVSGGGSLYRPFTQQSQGAFNTSISSGMIPTVNNINNASTMYVQPAPQ